MSLKQDQTVYFNLGENKPQGWATVSGVQGFVVIIKPFDPVPDYEYTHLYVIDTQIVSPPADVQPPPGVVYEDTAPVVPQEVDDVADVPDVDEYPFATGHESPPEGKETF